MNRSYQKELLDGTNLPFEDIRKNMEELDLINTHLGGHKISTQGISILTQNISAAQSILVVEIGCGGGDNLRALRKWADHHQRKLELSGIDINPECIAFARQQKNNSGINFICSDFRDVIFNRKPQIIFSSLFCHHFTEEELVTQLQWMKNNSSIGFFINDLHRHPLAYHSIKLLTKLFSRSYLVKNDAPLSVKRGLSRKEWKAIFHQARISSFECRWRWAFRWLITCTCN
ncbi:MAG: methyltransferase domain-containing protein [Flavisolibacter sp.]